MKTISTGRIFKIYDDSLKTYDRLPAQSYSVRFSKMEGFYLEKHQDIEVSEEKIYGVHLEKVEKVLKNFKLIDRNLGIILSGNKGIGKSLFAKILSTKAIESGYPVIIVDSFIPGIASYIEDIEQECVILFDEFDKTFGNIKTGDNEADPQAGLLSLFDGMAQGKKLFIVTCNELRYLNDYLINRPGRFHYHIRFEYPSPQEVREYLMDKLEEKYWTEIDKVIMFSRKIDLNYDCLRAISFELNLGEPFEEAIKDLNIINMNSEKYDVVLTFRDGSKMTSRGEYLDLFSQDSTYVNLYDSQGRDLLAVNFIPSNNVFDKDNFVHYISTETIKIDYDEDYSAEVIAKVKSLEIDSLTVIKCKAKEYHYTV